MTGFDPSVRTAGADPDDERWYSDWSLDEWDEVGEVAVVEPLRRQNRVVKWTVWVVLAVVTGLVLVVGYVGWWYLGKVEPSQTLDADSVQFTVDDADTVATLAARLEAAGLIEDASVFEWYTDNNGGLEIAPGYYELPANAHMGEVLAGLRTPPAETYRKITFPEGFTLAQIAARLAEQQPSLDAQAFLDAAATAVVPEAYGRPAGEASLEGLVFPDTYQISNDDNEAQVIERMAGLMERVAVNQEGLVEGAAEFGLTPYQVLTVASMVEKEAKLDADRSKIARVIYNRLYLGMPLQIDATLLYGQPAGSSPGALAEIDGPYNTYTRTGLPPTPIANPGRASIEAALHPAPNPASGDPICAELPDRTQNCLYLYYVIANAEGGHAFASTYEQHQANVDAARDAGLL